MTNNFSSSDHPRPLMVPLSHCSPSAPSPIAPSNAYRDVLRLCCESTSRRSCRYRCSIWTRRDRGRYAASPHRGRQLFRSVVLTACLRNRRQTVGRTYLQHRYTAPPPHCSFRARDPGRRQLGRAAPSCRTCRRLSPSWLLAWTWLVATIGVSWREVVGGLVCLD
jgi:hypothetical protein